MTFEGLVQEYKADRQAERQRERDRETERQRVVVIQQKTSH